MSKNLKIQKFKSFNDFYKCSVSIIKNQNPDFTQLDGALNVSSRRIFAYFWHEENLWAVHADTRIEKLDLAFKRLIDDKIPFLIQTTKMGKNKCLTIYDDHSSVKHFYVYLTKSNSKAVTKANNK